MTDPKLHTVKFLQALERLYMVRSATTELIAHVVACENPDCKIDSKLLCDHVMGEIDRLMDVVEALDALPEGVPKVEDWPTLI
jgi:hypothetical protein